MILTYATENQNIVFHGMSTDSNLTVKRLFGTSTQHENKASLIHWSPGYHKLCLVTEKMDFGRKLFFVTRGLETTGNK